MIDKNSLTSQIIRGSTMLHFIYVESDYTLVYESLK
jgi:hypothetical protein